MDTQFTQPRWKPIGQYRTFPLPILPILPPMKRIVFDRSVQKKKQPTSYVRTQDQENALNIIPTRQENQAQDIQTPSL